jgi:ABC-2 type transport system ATP-binding protein
MRQRLGVARSLLSDPELLVLDEPSNGLDPAGIAEFRGMIRGFVEDEGRTVFLSSHLLDEIERTCDDVAIVNRGAVVAQGGIGALLAEGRRGLVVQVDRPEAARAVLAPIPAIRGVELGPRHRILVDVDPIDDHAAIQVSRILVEAGVGVAGLWPQVETLEQRYLALTADTVPDDEFPDSLPTPAPPGVPRRRSEGRARRTAPRVRA